MARIFMTGLEAGSLNVFSAVNSGAEVSTTQKRTGNYSLSIPSASDNATIAIPGSPSEIYMRMGLYMTGGNSSYSRVFLRLMDTSDLTLITCYVDYNTMRIVIKRGTYSGTTLGTSTTVISPDMWYLLELHVVISDSSGVAQLKIDGNLDINASSVDTKPGTISNIGSIIIGAYGSYVLYGYFDDIAINDTTGSVNNSWIGQGGIYALTPNGAGTSTQLTPSSGANYTCVDDIPPDDDTSYVESNVQDEIDTYALSASAGEGMISAVQWLARAKANSTGTTAVTRVLRINGTNYVGGDNIVSTSYVYKTDILEKNPDDSAAWEYTDLDAMEAGVKVR